MIPPILHFYGHGKLLLAGEYFVLDGGLSLALPCRFGQQMEVKSSAEAGLLRWESLDDQKQTWFSAVFSTNDLAILESSDLEAAGRLQKMLLAAKALNPEFLAGDKGYAVRTILDFPRAWGLGTSSTLIKMLGDWAKVDPFQLSHYSLGGSGYDIAAAAATGPFYYQTGLPPLVSSIAFEPSFANQLYFVYLGKKQNSREGIQHYRKHVQGRADLIEAISEIVRRLANAPDLDAFSALLQSHEAFIGEHLSLRLVQDQYFSDFWGTVKSLGAWGGDFVLVTSDRSEKETRKYFNERGYQVFFQYEEMILKS